MPPAKPAPKRVTKPKAAVKRTSKPTATCKTCGRKIRIPEGWTVGPAVRRHYWAKHRSTMQPDRDDA